MARKYAVSTVTRAHRRVLRLALDTIEDMPERQRSSLRTCGAGFITFDELCEHLRTALELKVRLHDSEVPHGR